MTEKSVDLAALKAKPSGIAYAYVGEGPNRMCLTRDPLQFGWLWSVTTQWSDEIGTGSFFGHWHEMMAYVLQRHTLTPEEYTAAYALKVDFKL